MKLTCLDEDGNPVFAGAEFIFKYGGSQFSVPGNGDRNGNIPIPIMDGHRPNLAVVSSFEGHWKTILSLTPGDVVCTLRRLKSQDSALWWRKIVGRGSPDSSLGAGIKVGIVDLAFRPNSQERNFRCFDIDGEEIGEVFPDRPSHGQRVARVLAQSGGTLDCQGIAPGADVYLIDVSKDEDLAEWDYEKIGPAINLLVNDFGVHLINISGGAPRPGDERAYLEATEILQLEIERALLKGACIVAAVGNDRKLPPAIPACFETVLGVGAIGETNIAPPDTMVGMYEIAANHEEGCIGRVSDDITVFHYVDSAIGNGLDVVAPGIGVFLKLEDARIIEYTGTSYAAPIVTGVWACILSSDVRYQSVPIASRSEWARKRLGANCVNLGMSGERQGSGLPVIA